MNDTDSSPESLRKFLESDDPSLVLMGLSMATGGGVEEELLPLVLAHALFAEDPDVVESAEGIFADHAPEALRNLSSALKAGPFQIDHNLSIACPIDHTFFHFGTLFWKLLETVIGISERRVIIQP